MRDVTRWIKTQDSIEPGELAEEDVNPEVIEGLQALWARDDRLRSSVYATMERLLEPFEHPSAMASTMSGADLDGFLLGPNTLYLCAPPDEQALFAPLFTTVTRLILRAAYTRQAATGHPVGLLVIVDEAANITRLDNLSELCTTAAGTGIQLVTVWHDIAQVEARYGAQAETLINNMSVLMALRSRDQRLTTLLDDLDDDTGPRQGSRRLRGLPMGHAVFVIGTDRPRTLPLITRFDNPALRLDLDL